MIFTVCLLIPFVIGLIYIELVWTVAMLLSVLENDSVTKALGRSMKLIRGKICVTFAVFLTLHIAFAGVLYAFTVLVVHRFISSLVGRIFMGIACYLLVLVLVHFTLVIQPIVYFVCKSYHNEDLSNVAEHLDVRYANLDGERDDIPLERV
ncbi:hypothetical protein MKW92_008506 [Papaver armeniacum]|nr:hypothetical protein MKW92_008506 [Papaver armeniacum]